MSEYVIQHLKPIALAAQDKLNQFKYRFNIISKAELVDLQKEDTLKQLIEAKEEFKFINEKPEDFIILKNVLATSLPYVNGNGDAFRAEDFEKVIKEGQLTYLQPAIIDWNHDFSPRGNTIHAEIMPGEVEIAGLGKQSVKHLVVYSVFYAWLFPYEAEQIREWAEKDILTFSMACGAEDIEYINGNNRVLVNPQFLANSIITPDKKPADKNAKLINMASQKNGSNDMDKIKELEDKVKTLEAALAEKEKQIADLKASNLAKEHEELKQKYEALVAEKEELVKEHEKVLAEKDTKINALTASLDEKQKEVESLQTKVDELKSKYVETKKAELEKINEDRKAKLAEFITDEEKLNKWFDKYQAQMTEEGEILVDNGFDEFVAILSETAKASAKPNDAEPSKKVKASQDNFVPADPQKKEKIIKSWA